MLPAETQTYSLVASGPVSEHTWYCQAVDSAQPGTVSYLPGTCAAVRRHGGREGDRLHTHQRWTAREELPLRVRVLSHQLPAPCEVLEACGGSLEAARAVAAASGDGDVTPDVVYDVVQSFGRQTQLSLARLRYKLFATNGSVAGLDAWWDVWPAVAALSAAPDAPPVNRSVLVTLYDSDVQNTTTWTGTQVRSGAGQQARGPHTARASMHAPLTVSRWSSGQARAELTACDGLWLQVLDLFELLGVSNTTLSSSAGVTVSSSSSSGFTSLEVWAMLYATGVIAEPFVFASDTTVTETHYYSHTVTQTYTYRCVLACLLAA